MKYTLDTSSTIRLKLKPVTREEAKMQALYCLMNTPIASVPCYREFGLNMRYLSMPATIAQTMMISSVADAFEQFFPELRIEKTGFDVESESAMTARIEVADNE